MSDKSEACPVCGASVIEDASQKEDTVATSNDNNNQELTPSKTKPKHKNMFLWIGIAIAAVIAIATTTIVIVHNNKEKQAAEQLREKHRVAAERHFALDWRLAPRQCQPDGQSRLQHDSADPPRSALRYLSRRCDLHLAGRRRLARCGA